MARLPRLTIAGHAHHIIQRGGSHQPICITDADRDTLRHTLLEAARSQHIALHGWCICNDQFQCIATPPEPQSLARMMQDIGRRYVRYFNRTHQRRGTLWDGRFRCTVVDPDNLLHVMACVDAQAAAATPAAPPAACFPSDPAPVSIPETGTGTALFNVDTAAATSMPAPTYSSAPHYLGLHTQPELTPPQQWWSLGNTPYEREAAYRALLDAALHDPQATAACVDAALHGWVTGSPAFMQRLQHLTSRRISKRSPGRPRRQSKG